MAHILIIEDDRDIADLLALTLSGHYDVTLAHDGKEGYMYIKEQAFDLILLDLMMPYMNDKGIQLTNSEFDILTILMKHPEVPLSKQKIFNALGNGTYVGDDNTVSVHVSNIRKKFSQITDEPYVKTVWGIGFMLI